MAIEPPKEREEPNFAAVLETVRFGVKEAVERGYWDDDLKHYIYEAAMEAVYGKDFWQWRRSQEWDGE